MSYGSNENCDPLKQNLRKWESSLRAMRYYIDLGILHAWKFNRHRPRRMFRLARRNCPQQQ
jgi:hypothetical protein